MSLDRSEVARHVWARVGMAVATDDHDALDDNPDTVIDRTVANSDRYPDGIAAVADECGTTTIRPELVDLLAAAGMEWWAARAKRAAARAAIAAGCPLRVAADAAGVTHQTIANWANE